jgi:rubrerythrin
MNKQVENLLYEALETEIGGVQVYTNAVACAQNDDLKKEWKEYLEQTRRHEQILRAAFETLGLDPEKETPGRKIVRHHGQSLVEAIEMARKGDPAAAQIVAAECVVLAETKDHQNWELIGEVAKKLEGKQKKALSEAHEEVEDEEDEHLYHTQGWTRELWLEALGQPAVLPPPEEKKDVKTAIGAARAKQSRKAMVRGRKSRSDRPSPRA